MNVFSLNKTRRADGTSDRIAEFASVTLAPVRNDLRRRTSRIGHGFRRQTLSIIFRTFETDQFASTRCRSFPFETSTLAEFVDQTIVHLRRCDTGQIDVVIHRRINVRNELTRDETDRKEKKNDDDERTDLNMVRREVMLLIIHQDIYSFQNEILRLDRRIKNYLHRFSRDKYVDVDILKRNQPSEKINDNVMICLFMISMLTRTHRYRSHS